MPAQGSAIAPIRDDAVRDAANAGGGLRGARIDKTTGARVFSAVVGTIFDGKNVTATMRTSVNGEQNITYHCHAYGLDVQARDIVWRPRALDFKANSKFGHGGEDQLDDGMAKAFMDELDNEIMEEEA